MPVITYPVAATLLVAVPALVAVYFLHTRHRPRSVSSLLLWEERPRVAGAGARVERLRVPWTFFLELLTLLLLVLAALAPAWLGRDRQTPVVVVLDGSVSMLARDGKGQTARQRCAAALKTLCERHALEPALAVRSGHDIQRLGEQSLRDLREGRVPADWECRGTRDGIDTALQVARQWFSDPRVPIIVVTDRLPETVPEDAAIFWLAEGVALPNIGLVGAARVESETGGTLMLSVSSYADRELAVDVELQIDGKPWRRLPVSLVPARNLVKHVRIPADAGPVTIQLPGDSLEIDNRIDLLPPSRAKVPVALEPGFAGHLRDATRRALESSGRARIVASSPYLAFRGISDADAACAVSVLVRQPAEAEALIGPFMAGIDDPLLEGAPLDGFAWGGAGDLNLPGLPLLAAGDTPLMTRQQTAGRQIVHLQLAPKQSTVLDHPFWPVFVWNVLEEAARTMPGVEPRNVRLGQAVAIRTDRGQVALINPSGRREEYPVVRGRASLLPSQPGIYRDDDGKAVLAVHFAAPEESDLRGASTGRAGGITELAMRIRTPLVLTVPFLVGALALLALHQFGLRRGAAT